MKLHTFHDLYRKVSISQAVLSDEESAALPSWLTPPTNPDICVQLKYLLEVAKYLQTVEEEVNMRNLEDEEVSTNSPESEEEQNEEEIEAGETAEEEDILDAEVEEVETDAAEKSTDQPTHPFSDKDIE